MKETFIIIGEGPTEYFFLTSLKDDFRTLQNIDPQYPKHTSMLELEQKIKNSIEQGYNHVYCMIDMDILYISSLHSKVDPYTLQSQILKNPYPLLKKGDILFQN